MVTTLQEIKKHNKRLGRHFFDRGNAPVIAKRGNYLVTRGMSNGYVVWVYNPNTGTITLVDNPQGEYSWQPYATASKAIMMADHFNKTN